MRFLMIGGFLGAGKTTTLARLARHYIDAGQKVALVTNDQAYGLVDTQSLRSQGFDVGEVPGACFCCKFEDLIETVAELSAEHRPDIILAEPVGSCTDLVSTVLRPLAHLYSDDYELAPLAVLCKPEHGEKILEEGQTGFSPQAAYLFLKQLEEAEVIVLNKIDKIDGPRREKLLHLLGQRFPNKETFCLSAQEGEGFTELVSRLEQASASELPTLEIDYDIYAEGEAELGWLNATVKVTNEVETQQQWPLDDLVTELVETLAAEFANRNLEPGHVKVLGSSLIGQGNLANSVANWVALGEAVELSVASQENVAEADILINARVASDPTIISETVISVVERVMRDKSLAGEIVSLQHFSPARPEPTHRMTS